MDRLDLVSQEDLGRIFRARNKIAFPGACCHITQRAVGSEPLFLEEGDYLYMLHLIKKKSKEFNFKVFSFALMPNHIHLLIQVSSENLSEPMKGLFEAYAKYFNSKYERKGHVFCGAYRCAICLDDSYLLAASLYIHLNPVKARIVDNPVEYRWSSCNLYLLPIAKSTFLNYNFILSLLDSNIENSRQIYKSLLNELIKERFDNVFEKPEALKRFRANFLKIAEKFQIKNLAQCLNKANLLSDEEIETKIKELQRKKRLKSPQDLNARKFVIQQLIGRGFTKQEIAKRLDISIFGIYRTLNAKNE